MNDNAIINLDVFIENYEQMNNFMRDNGIKHTVIVPGNTETRMTILEKHLSSPMTSHGGAMSGFMDSVLGFSALSKAIVEGNLVSTVEFKLNYFKPIFLGNELVGKAIVKRHGKSLIVATAEIFRDDELVAIGQGTFNVYPLEKRTNIKNEISS